ncbi:MAG: membrane protease subunit, stomatin/prohibitin [Nitrospirae bacterium]|nr:membrane protease subunit, stomatin/prohibitin [Nitrospirota bacterium]
MFGIRHMKCDAMTYVIHYKNGQIKREGNGLSFFYYEPGSSIAMVGLGSNDVAFKIQVSTMDYHSITIEGNIVYKVEHPGQLMQMLDLTVDHNGRYKKKDYEKLHMRFIHEAHRAALAFVQGLTLKGVMHVPKMMEEVILEELKTSKLLTQSGVTTLGVSIFSITPPQDIERALKTQTLEVLHQDTMQTIYDGKIFDIEQKTKVQDVELSSELALEDKKKQVNDMKVEADYAAQYHKRHMREMEIQSDILIEEQKKKLIELLTENNKAITDSNNLLLHAILMPLLQSQNKAISQSDIDQGTSPLFSPRVLEFLRGLADNAARLGTFQISPELLKFILPQHAGHNGNEIDDEGENVSS